MSRLSLRSLTGFVLACATFAAAQLWSPRVSARTSDEQVIVSTFSPSSIQGYHYDGGFVTDDLDPRTSETKLFASLDLVRTLVATDRYLLTIAQLTGLPVAIVDRATGAELSRPRMSELSLIGLAASPDGRFAYALGSSSTGVSLFSILDLRAESPTFGTEIKVITLAASTGLGGLAVDPTGTRAFILEQVNVPTPAQTHLVTVDVTTPATAAVIKDIAATDPIVNVAPAFEQTGNGRLHTFSTGGNNYLMVPRRQTQIYKIQADGSLTYVQTLALVQPGNVRDAVFTTTGGAKRIYAITTRTAAPFTVTVVAYDMTASGAGFAGTNLGAATIDTQTAAEGPTQIAASLDGSRLYLARIFNSTIPPTLVAVNAAAVVSAPGTAVLATQTVGGSTSNAVGLAVVASIASPVTVTGVSVDGVPNAVLVNDTTHTVTVTGTNLANTHQAFIGLTRATVVSATSSSVTITSPALVPANTSPIVVVGDDGNAAGTITVANPADYFPSYVVYASSTGTNRISVLNAATGTSVVRQFDSGPGPSDAAPTADGRFLVVGNFRGNGVTIHSVSDDPAHGYTADQIVAQPTFGTTVQRVVANPVRKRVYAASLNADAVAVIDVDADSATFGTVLSTIGVPAGAQIRAIAISPDGSHLYIARINAPQLLVADVSTDAVPAPVQITLSGPASANGRADGLAVSPDGQRLYFMNSGDTFMRIFDTTSPAAPVQISTVALPGGSVGDVHRIQVLPNNRFVYVASRNKAAVDVFDTAAHAFVASVATGAFSNDPAVSRNSNYVFVGVAENDAVLTVDARETVNGFPNPNLHHIVASTGGGVGVTATSVTGGIATSGGTNVTVQPLPGVSVTFANVTTPGLTTATSTNLSNAALPPYYFNPGLAAYVSVESSAAFSGGVTVCFAYSDAGLTATQEGAARLLHLVGGSYVDVTSSTDTGANTACGTSSDLGQFVVAFYDDDAPVVTPPASQTIITSATSVTATFNAPTASDALSGVASLTCDHASGETFPLGVTTITCTATDRVGRTGSATFTITVLPENLPPVCSAAAPSIASIWPANHQMVPVTVLGVTDPDGTGVTIRITAILQDEPVNSGGDGNTTFDGSGVNTSTAQVRAERSGQGNGRFYHIRFTATDPSGATCDGEVKVIVPKSQGKNDAPVDGGALYNSTVAPVAIKED